MKIIRNSNQLVKYIKAYRSNIGFIPTMGGLHKGHLSLITKAKHKKVLKATKGHYGARSRLFKTAKQSNIKALQYAFRDRRNKKRTFRSLWISRISAALIPLEVSYSRFINQLSQANIKLDRKSLAGIAFSDPDTFKKIVEKVRV